MKKNKDIILEFNKRFAYGDQHLYINNETNTIEDKVKTYYWEEIEVYNHILPIVNMFETKYDVNEEDLYGEYGLVHCLIPIQRAYNALKNRKYELIKRMAQGVLVVEDGSVDIDNLEEEGLPPNKVLVYRQGSKEPKFLKIESDLNIIVLEENQLLQEFAVITECFKNKFSNKEKK